MERLDRLVFTHRRLLAAVCAGLAMLFLVAALGSERSTRGVVVVTTDLSAGTVLTDEHVEVRDLDASGVPDGALDDTAAAIGLPLAGPVRSGEVVTDRRVVDARDLDGFGVDDPSLATVRVADPSVLTGLRVGDRVDVIALDPQGDAPPEVVTSAAVVASLPHDGTRAASGPGPGSGDVVGLVAPAADAVALAARGLDAGITLVTAAGGGVPVPTDG